MGWAALAVGALVAVILGMHGPTLRGCGMLLGFTAMTSTAFFLAAFTASAFYRCIPSAATRWQVRNRRYLGVSFAVSHTYHLGAIIGYARLSDEPLPTATIMAGGLAFVFLFAMAATSFDRTAAWLGPRWWKRLHTTGVYYLWFVFAVTYLGDGAPGLRQGVFLVLLFGALVLRVAARFTPRNAPA